MPTIQKREPFRTSVEGLSFCSQSNGGSLSFLVYSGCFTDGYPVTPGLSVVYGKNN
jgi:hypothetical protein